MKPGDRVYPKSGNYKGEPLEVVEVSDDVNFVVAKVIGGSGAGHHFWRDHLITEQERMLVHSVTETGDVGDGTYRACVYCQELFDSGLLAHENECGKKFGSFQLGDRIVDRKTHRGGTVLGFSGSLIRVKIDRSTELLFAPQQIMKEREWKLMQAVMEIDDV